MSKVQTIQEEPEATIKLLDWIIVIDHSASMSKPSLRFQGKNRLEEVAETVCGVAREVQKYDDDGLTVIPFSGHVTSVYDGVTADRVESVFAEFHPSGSTNLAAAIKAVSAKARSSKKDVVALIYTDGEPDSESAVISEINQAAKEFGRPRIGFVFIQVGQDSGAARFLEKLDDELKVDVVATVPEEQSEDLTPAQLAWLARNA